LIVIVLGTFMTSLTLCSGGPIFEGAAAPLTPPGNLTLPDPIIAE